MAFQVSPGVSVSEIDLTTRVPIPSISDGAVAGPFKWGPLEEIRLVSSEQGLIDLFGKPDANTYKGFFTAANFLSYSDKLKVVRAANTESAKNATTSGSGYLIKNDREYQNTYESVTTAGVDFFSRYPGEIGNSLKISLCQPTRANTKVVNNVVTVDANSDMILTGNFVFSGTGSIITTDDDAASAANVDIELRVGDVLFFDGTSFDASSTKIIVTEIFDTNTFSVIQEDGTLGLGENSIQGFELIRYKRSAFSEPPRNMFGTLSYDGTGNNTIITGVNTQFELQLSVGDIITFNDGTVAENRRRVESITNSTSIVVSTPLNRAFSGVNYYREWEFRTDFQTEPITSEYAYKMTSNKDVLDEVHLIIVDEDGLITGRKDIRGDVSKTQKTVLESYPNLSVANGATQESTGETLYYKDHININSQYIRWGDHNAAGDIITYTDASDVDITTPTKVWGDTLEQGNTSARFIGPFSTNSAGTGVSSAIITSSFGGGNDGTNISDSDLITAYEFFKEPSKVDVSLILSGEASNTVANYLISDLAEYRKDCVVFISPEESDVVNVNGLETINIIARRTALPSSSYAVMDGNYKYQLDRFNSVYRYVPLNGDIAGLCAQSDNVNPYISPAGFNRGNVKANRLAFEPSGLQRDALYVQNINPVVGFPGQGIVLFGDKTMLAKPSAFDRINVRRLFIILEKAIANAAQFSLFEFNDDFTRSQFVSIVEPFLREVQSRRGITDFRVVCDESNNPPSVIDRNEFRGDIFIKPNRSINFINLNFVAVASGVEFSEVVNAI